MGTPQTDTARGPVSAVLLILSMVGIGGLAYSSVQSAIRICTCFSMHRANPARPMPDAQNDHTRPPHQTSTPIIWGAGVLCQPENLTLSGQRPFAAVFLLGNPLIACPFYSSAVRSMSLSATISGRIALADRSPRLVSPLNTRAVVTPCRPRAISVYSLSPT